MAENIGCIAEPEILVRKLSSRDRFIICASDGIFEFITNQEAADMIGEHYPDNPMSACDTIVDTSWQKWMERDERSDDITVVCAFIGK